MPRNRSFFSGPSHGRRAAVTSTGAPDPARARRRGGETCRLPSASGARLGRREALALLLGGPLAATACRFLPKRRVEGQIRGSAVSLGHRLRAPRSAASVETASGDAHRVEIAIVGAGPSGLSAAWRLEQLDERRYVVFELENGPGGTSAFGTDGVVPYPWGAHYVPLPTAENRALVRLFGEVGALEPLEQDELGRPRIRARETVLVREPEERLFLAGAWRPGLAPLHGASPSDRAEFERFSREIDGWVARRDSSGRRAFAVPVARSSSDAAFTELDRISAATFLDRRGYSSKRLRWYVEYACRDDYGLSLEHTSAWAMLFYFAARVPDPGKPSAPFVTFPEGNGRLVRHLADVAGDRLLLGRLVTDVVPREDGVELAALDARTGNVVRYVADRVILAVPKFVAAKILRPFREDEPNRFRDFTFGAWMVANVHLKWRPRSPGFPFAWDNVLYESPSLGYVVATHQALVDDGPTVWTYYYPLVDPDPNGARAWLLEADHAALSDVVLADLGRAHDDLESAVERVDVWRWGHAMVRPVPGFIWGDARRRSAAPVGRVHFAHSDLSGVALFEEAQYQGVRAAEEVLRARGRDVSSLLD